MLNKAAGRVGSLDVGFTPPNKGKNTAKILSAANKGDVELLFLLNADNHLGDKISNMEAFTVYIGSHGDIGAHHADLILPAAAYTEKRASFVNLEGRFQQTNKAVNPPGDAQEDWQIIHQIANNLHIDLDITNRTELDTKLHAEFPYFTSADNDNVTGPIQLATPKNADKLLSVPFKNSVYRSDFYLADPISRASVTMAKCVEEVQ